MGNEIKNTLLVVALFFLIIASGFQFIYYSYPLNAISAGVGIICTIVGFMVPYGNKQ